MNLPEGLHLDATSDKLRVIDAQDVAWVTFEVGGNGDSIEWRKTVVEQACFALGVTEVFMPDGDLCSFDSLLDSEWEALVGEDDIEN